MFPRKSFSNVTLKPVQNLLYYICNASHDSTEPIAFTHFCSSTKVSNTSKIHIHLLQLPAAMLLHSSISVYILWYYMLCIFVMLLMLQKWTKLNLTNW